MVISVPSLQDTEIYRPKPSPVYSFVDDVNKMVDIKGEETALQASRREAQEGVKVKFPNMFWPIISLSLTDYQICLKYMSPP